MLTEIYTCIKIVLVSILIAGCGVFIGNHADEETVSNETTPDDSTGDTGTMTLTVSSDEEYSLQNQVTLPNGLTIKTGKVVVTNIKLFALEEISESERAIEQTIQDFDDGESEESIASRQGRNLPSTILKTPTML